MAPRGLRALPLHNGFSAEYATRRRSAAEVFIAKPNVAETTNATKPIRWAFIFMVTVWI